MEKVGMGKKGEMKKLFGKATVLALLLTGFCILVGSPGYWPVQADGGHEEGRFTGGGFIVCGDQKITFGFELYCREDQGPNNLEINFGGSQFHLENIETLDCFNNGDNPAPPAATADTINVTGSGRFRSDGVETPAFIAATFHDSGEPGREDTASFLIYYNGVSFLNCSGNLLGGNVQAHRLTGSKAR
jgi:hypothetical protein